MPDNEECEPELCYVGIDNVIDPVIRSHITFTIFAAYGQKLNETVKSETFKYTDYSVLLTADDYE